MQALSSATVESRRGRGAIERIGRGCTHQKPRQKTPISMTFCLFGSCRLLITGRGSEKITKSVIRFMAAITYHTADLACQLIRYCTTMRPWGYIVFLLASWFRHFPGTLGSQNLATGVQTRGSSTDSVIAQDPSKIRPTRVSSCMSGTRKIRLYWKRMDILRTQVPTLYTIILLKNACMYSTELVNNQVWWPRPLTASTQKGEVHGQQCTKGEEDLGHVLGGGEEGGWVRRTHPRKWLQLSST